MTKPPLKEYQRENVDWIRRVRRGLLADEPGLGKSRSALEGFAGAGRVLIVAPNLIVKSGNWHDEVERWGDDGCQYHLASYHDLNRRVRTGKGSGTKPVNALKPEWRGHWDAVIFDEAHYLKGRDTMWTKTALTLSRNTDNLLLLTGTPIPNWAYEVYSMLRMIHVEEGKRGNEELGSYLRWAERWFDSYANPHALKGKIVGDLLGCTPACKLKDPNDPCDHYRRFALSNFGDHYMRHLRDDHLDLPPIEFVDVSTPLDAETRRLYRELKKDFATSIEGKELLTWSVGAQNVALDKMTTSPWLLNMEGEPRGGKFERLRSDLRKRDRPTLVLAHYRDSVEASARVGESVGCRTAFIHGGTTDAANYAAIRAFKAGKLDLLVGSLETLAEGLTLTVADHAIFLERSYKPSRNTQATYRIYRLGQDRACTITRYITPNSIDSNKEKLLNEKTDHQIRTLSAADFLRLA